MPLSYDKRQKIIAKALQEIQFARTYKQGKVRNWQKNEELYYSKKQPNDGQRANVDLGLMQAYVHTILSKIDNPLIFKYTKRKNSQIRKVKRLNSLRVMDQQRDFWDIKDIAGKKQAIIYGRSIFSYFADSMNGYKSHLDNVDVYDFLIDPSAGGIDIEKARYLGDYGVVLDRSDLKAGIKDGIFLRTETNMLLDGTGNATESSQEKTNKQNRTRDQHIWTPNKEISDEDKFKFWRWGTTYQGQRYYLLLSETGAQAIRVDPIEEVFESSLWWYWTWAAFPDLTEFWTPSYCDYVREVFMAQAVSINQMLDNAEQVNKPQKAVDVGAIEDLAELKYKKDGIIRFKKKTNINEAFQTVTTQSITTPINVFNLLDGIVGKSSGVTAATQGAADTDGKVGIYDGNQENSADRFGFLNRSYSFGYHRFSILYEWGVRENLIKREAIDLLGPEGIETEMINRTDIFGKNDKFGVLVEASNAEVALSESEKKQKIAFLESQSQNPMQNQQKAYEIEASISGFDEETIRELLDTANFGSAELMGEADRDIEDIDNGKKVKPNQWANIAYKQRFVDYLRDHQEDMDLETFKRFGDYIVQLDSIITRNMVRSANQVLATSASSPTLGNNQPGGGTLPQPKAGVETLSANTQQ